MATHGATPVRTGSDVYGANGETIGTVADVSRNYFVIERGFGFKADLFVPISAVARVADERIELNLTTKQLEEGNFVWPIGGDSVSDRDDGTPGHGLTS